MPGAPAAAQSKTTPNAKAGPSRPTKGTITPKPPPKKPYEVCRYFKSERGCYNGRNCRFLHDGEEPPKEESKTCVYYAKGHCLHGERCWYKHIRDSPAPLPASQDATEGDSSGSGSGSKSGEGGTPEEHEIDVTCAICYDTPTVFGLLTGCSHAFCLSCLRDWRKPGKTTSISNSKLCPMCRAPSRYITPSSLFFKEGDPRKTKAIETYKASMGKVSCKYFERSLPGRRSCPYGDDCFYKHEEEEGKRYMFNHGVDQMMDVFKNELRRQPRRRRRMIIYDDYDDLDFDGFSDGPDPLDDWSTHAGLHIEPDNEWLPTETGIQWGTSPTGWDWSVATWGTVSAWGTLAD